METEQADKPKEEKFLRGDYRVHIYIEESKGLMSNSSDEFTNPVISLRCFGKVKVTKKLKGVGPTMTSIWNEHIYFSKLKCSVSDIQSEKILIRLKDSKILTDALIGSYEFDLTHIYYQNNHCILHTWVALSNPYSEDVSIMRGLLKLSISVLHSKDAPVDLTTDTQKEEIIVPPQVSIETKQLVIQFFIAQNLPIMDKIGTLDVYCVAKFGNVECRTIDLKADKTNLSVRWNEEIWLPVIQPCIATQVEIFVWDKDFGTDDDLVGLLKFKWKDVKTENEAEARWSNIYGAPHNIEAEGAREMNLFEECASNWRGRILMRLFCRDHDRPIVTKQDIDKELVKDVMKMCRGEKFYRLMAHIYQGVNLPAAENKYSVRVSVDQISIESKVAENVNGTCKWFEKLPSAKIGVPVKSYLPDIFVYLMDGDDQVCYARLKTKEYRNLERGETWIKLSPNKVVKKDINDWEGGYILMRICVVKFKVNEFPKCWKEKIAPSANSITRKLVCNLYQCRNLPASDPNGLGDPYVKIVCGSNSASTNPKAKLGILNPMWYTQLILDIEYITSELSPPIILQVWDYDALSTDDLMGIFCVGMEDIPVNPEVYPRASWHKLSLGSEDTEEGEVLVSFSVFDLTHTLPQFVYPESMEVDVEIYALGLRDLKPALGWLPVNKAFICIDLNACSFPGETLMINEVKTEPISPGANPNMGAVMKFRCKIAKDPLYCPSISCNVYDYLMRGVCQPIIGTFSIDLNKIMSVKYGFRRDSAENKGEILPAYKAYKFLVNKNFIENIDKSCNELVQDCSLSLSEAMQEGKIVVMPVFKDEAEGRVKEQKFQDSNYISLGYNRKPNDGYKHYRYFVPAPLEKSRFFGKPPFKTYKIKKGQTRGLSKGLKLLSKKISSCQKLSTLTISGYFKGIVRVTFPGKLNLPNELNNDGYEKIAKLLLTKTECLVRIYIIDAYDLTKKFHKSACDPYIVIKHGHVKISDKENYITNSLNPKFHRCFEVNTVFPGESTLKIAVWDYSRILTDKKIGTTIISLEDRFFNETWNKLPQKPVETRKLKIKSSSQPQGYLRLWIEILPASNESLPKWDIVPRPPVKFEIRAIVWDCQDVESQDIEDASDLFVKAFINNQAPKETDTHFRAQNGFASWNWRLKFPIEYVETEQVILTFQLWDRDYFSINDAIGDHSINLTSYIQDSLDLNSIVKYFNDKKELTKKERQENERFWISVKTLTKEGKEKVTGRVRVSIEILPWENALAVVNGEGRNEPNVEPKLPRPDGRFELTLNPFKLFHQMVGPRVRRKIYLLFCSVICCIILFIYGGLIMSDIFLEIVLKP